MDQGDSDDSSASDDERDARRRARFDKQREKLVLAAAKVFARDGFAGASVAAILDLADVGRGTFYRHFHDLDDILLAVERYAADSIFACIEEKVRAETEPPEKLRAGVTGYLMEIGRNGDLLRVLHREGRARSDEHDEIRQQAMERFVRLIQEGVAEAHRRGMISRIPDEMTLFALSAALRGVGWRYLMAGEEDRAIEAAPALLDMWARVLV